MKNLSEIQLSESFLRENTPVKKLKREKEEQGNFPFKKN